jgi:pilus assembly protein Flp/PilA
LALQELELPNQAETHGKRRISLKSNSIGKQRERFDPYKRRAQGASKYRIDMHKLLRFLKDNSGVTAIEYGLLAAGVAVAIIAAVNAPAHQCERHV